jgi:hypothetical protein
LEEFIKQGGRALFISEEPKFAVPAAIKKHELTRVAYIEVKDPDEFPSLSGLKYLMATSMCPYTVFDIFSQTEITSMQFIEYPEERDASLTFVPAMIENPAEVSQSDLKHTNIPAVLKRDHGTGKIAYLPWDLGALYDRLALPQHAQLLTDMVDQLLVKGRQLKTNAHSSVEMVLSAQEKSKRLMLHLINLSGQTQNNYMDAIPMSSIEVSVMGKYMTARTRDGQKDLDVKHTNDRTEFTVPVLKEYEVIVLESHQKME